MENNGYNIVLQDCMGIKPHETVLVLTDDDKMEIGLNLYREAKKISKEAVFLMMNPRSVSGEEPPEEVAATMKKFDVIICPTSKSLTHTNAKMEAVKAGARLASMPGITEEMFYEGAVTANYKEVEELTLSLTELLTKASKARIEKDGYSLHMNLGERKAVPSTGIYRNPGEAGNLPSGESYIAPIENSSNGKVLVDGSMVGIGLLETPILFTIVDGKIVNIEGNYSGKLDVLLENPFNSTLGELGIGTNKAARLTGVILEDEKIYGTVHVAFGTNTSFGGSNKANCHMDGVILKPTLYLDDKLVIKEGKVLF
jgi:leucyl aminopeptidase (aminopeptidase T)